MGGNMKENKKENIYYCFRYRCKVCPKQVECEKEIKKEGDLIGKGKKNRQRNNI